MRLFCLILTAGLLLAAPARAEVAECIWARLPQAYRDAVAAAPDFDAFSQLRRTYPLPEAETAFAACVPQGNDDASAESAFAYYEASMWARRKLVFEFTVSDLDAVDAIPETDLRYLWLQPPAEQIDAAYALARTEAWKRAYGPFGRTGPTPGKRDALDVYILGRVGWRLFEMDYRTALARR